MVMFLLVPINHLSLSCTGNLLWLGYSHLKAHHFQTQAQAWRAGAGHWLGLHSLSTGRVFEYLQCIPH